MSFGRTASLTLGLLLAAAELRAETCPAPPAAPGAPPAVHCTEPPPVTADLSEPPLFGEKDGLFYFRDPHDIVRLYPHSEVNLDGHGFFHETTRPTSGQVLADLGPHFLVRHAIFNLSGELFKTFSFDAGFDLVANPAVDGARADGRQTRVALTDAWGAVDAGRGFWLRAGVFAAPYSLENTTRVADLGLLERTTATRFVVPGNRLLGVSLGGSTLNDRFRMDAGAFGMETLTPGEFDRIFDGILRFTWRPGARAGKPEDQLVALGASGRMGSRNRRDNANDLPALTTSQGLALWKPFWLDPDGTLVHAIGSGTQYVFGGELRVPARGFALTGEFNYLYRNTMEIPESAPNATLRKGNMRGTTSYVELSFWPLQLFGLIDGYPPVRGKYPKKDHLEVASVNVLPERYGLEVTLLASHVLMHYDAASRFGAPDPYAPPGHIATWQLSAGAAYWQTERFKLAFNFNWYVVPQGRLSTNGADVPGNAAQPGNHDPTADWVGEAAFRFAARF
jgi:hypothetical protein